jgi:hypothetical protein
MFEKLLNELESLGAAVGFKTIDSIEAIDDIIPPSNIKVYLSSFAYLILVPIESMELEALESTVKIAQDWIWRLLVQEERRANYIDGYLLLVLPEFPNNNLWSHIQQIVLDTSVCRKHVLWPSKDGNWSERLWSVTALGLPQAQNVKSGTVLIPKLPWAAERALQLYNDSGTYDKTAEEVLKEAQVKFTQEDNNAS